MDNKYRAVPLFNKYSRSVLEAFSLIKPNILNKPRYIFKMIGVCIISCLFFSNSIADARVPKISTEVSIDSTKQIIPLRGHYRSYSGHRHR